VECTQGRKQVLGKGGGEWMRLLIGEEWGILRGGKKGRDA
jgi:hypothetical protein